MALFGALQTIREQLAGGPEFETAFAHAAEALSAGSPLVDRISRLRVGETVRVELEGGVFSLLQAYESKPSADVKWESHRRFIDLQLVVAGEEGMEVTDIGALTVAEDHTPEKDLILYGSLSGASSLRVGTGQAAIFFPVDAHRPSLAVVGPRLVRKVVVKIPVVKAARV